MERILINLNIINDKINSSSSSFISKYDSLCLTSIDINEDNLLTSSSSSFSSSLSNNLNNNSNNNSNLSSIHINSLDLLIKEINEILNYGLIHQQIILTRLNNELNILINEINEIKNKYNEDNNENNNNNKEINYNLLPLSMNNKIELNDINIEDKSTIIILLKKQFHYHLQKLYNETFLLLQIKTKSFELIDIILGRYTDEIAKLAEQSNVAHAIQRAQLIVCYHAKSLLRHRFMDTTEIRDLLQSIQHQVSITYLRGHDDFAGCKLATQSQPTDTSIFHKLSFKIGVGFILLLWAISECVNNEKFGQDIWMDPTFAIFICLGDLILLLFMWGVSLYVWRTTGINYIQLLSLQNTDYSALYTTQPKQIEINILHITLNLSIIYLVSFLVFNKTLRGIFSIIPGDAAVAHAIPTFLFVYFVYYFFYPYSKRKIYINMLWKVITAPFHPVSFRDGYIGDLLTSLVRVFHNLTFSLIYLTLTIYWWITNHVNAAESIHSPTFQHTFLYRYVIIPFLTLFPLWVRLMQCLKRSVETGQRWPHYFNALKYSSAMIVFSFSLFRPNIQENIFWLFSLVFATCYQFIWDITMDWGLVKWNKKEEKFEFRKERSLCSFKWYLIIMSMNLLLRFSWAVTLLPEDLTRYSTFYSYIYTNFQTLMAAAEIIRRMVWGFIRLEWEYIEKFGTAPIPIGEVESLEFERSLMYQKNSKSKKNKNRNNNKDISKNEIEKDDSQNINILKSFLELEKMEISSSLSTSSMNISSNSFLDYCWRMGCHETGEDWEWMEYFNIQAENIFSHNILSKYSTNSKDKWAARIIEGFVLVSFIIFMIGVAASKILNN